MSKIDIVKVLADPSIRYWVKSAINNLLERDPVDAYKDASLLAQIFKQRMDELLEEAKNGLVFGTDGWQTAQHYEQKPPQGWEVAQ